MCKAEICSDIVTYDLVNKLGLKCCDYLDNENASRIKPGKNDLSIIEINIRGLLNKQDHLKDLLRSCSPDVVLICESWLNSHTESLIDIPGYKLYNKNRIDRIGGGVGMLVKKELRSRIRNDLYVETQHLEHIVVELKTDRKNLLLVSGYRPPNTRVKTLLTEYKRLLIALKKNKHHELVLGLDHNLDLLKAHSHKQTNEFLELNLSHDLIPCITKPTRITHATATLIDNIFISPKLQHTMTPYILTDDISDHLPIVAMLGNQKKSLRESKIVKTRDFSDQNIEKIKAELSELDWTDILTDLDCNDSFNKFHQILCKAIDKHAPETQRKISYQKLARDPWITKGIINSLTKQKRLYREQLQNKSDVSTRNYRQYRNLLQSVMRKSRNTYLHNKCREFKQDSRKLWQLVNKLIGKSNNKSDSIDSLRIENILKYDPSSITNGLCDFFSQIGEKYANQIESTEPSIEHYIGQIPQNSNSMFMAPTTGTKIKEIIQSLPHKTSSGYDRISNVLLKNLNETIVLPLSIIFNKSLEEGTFPDQMKFADVMPLFKAKDRTECTNYRPISLLLTLSKLLEKVVYRRTYKFLETHNQLFVSQYGFREGHSCENAISELISQALKGKQEGMYTLALFLDLSKAFDSLEHNVLLKKLERYGIRGKTNEWFASYLPNRKMRVKCTVSSTGKQECSNYQKVNYGTPQGSCLGPLIFIIFTNDLHKQMTSCSSLLFADDTTLYMTHRNLRYLKWCIEEDMKRLIKWFKSNKLTLNLDKTVCILFQKNGIRESIEIDLDSIKIRNDKLVKFLGMWLDEYITWHAHIQKLILKMTRNTNLLKHGQNMMPKETKKLIYHAHLGSHLQYGIMLWGNSVPEEQLLKMQKIQNKCIKYITGIKSITEEQNKDLKILKIKDTIHMANLKFGYKLLHKLLPKKVAEASTHDSKRNNLMPSHGYNTRSRLIPNLPKCMNKSYKDSFLCKGPRSILSINVETRYSKSIEAFTLACKRQILNDY